MAAISEQPQPAIAKMAKRRAGETNRIKPQPTSRPAAKINAAKKNTLPSGPTSSTPKAATR